MGDRPADGRAGGRADRRAPRRRTGPWADVVTHTIAVAPAAAHPTRVVLLGTLGGRGMDVMTVDVGVAPAERVFRSHTTFGSAWQRRFRQPTMVRVDAPGAGGPIETWIASPTGAGDAPLPTIVDVHGGPLGCWAPAPHHEVTMLTGAGYRVVLPNIRGSAGYGRGWIRPQLGDWGGVDADDVHAALDHVIALGLAEPGAARHPRAELRRLHGELDGRHDRPLPRRGVGERRDQPGHGLGQLRQRPRVLPGRAARRPVHARGHRPALAPVAAAPRRATCAPRC